MKQLITFLIALFVAVGASASTEAYRANKTVDNPTVISALLDRIDTSKTLSQRLTTRLDESLTTADGREQFTISGTTISGSSLIAIATGVNWFLNHRLHVNLSWNQLTADFSQIAFPEVWTDDIETHVCDADYRYYLNYCTFGYSMTTWTWERWQQEIDWMALHGINMPLQIVGLEEVWRRTLRAYNYTDAEAKAFAAGPAFTAWWGMNNLEGWGGTQDDAWFTRQTALAGKIGDRMREFGMEPVLPGFASTVPHDFTKKNPAYATESQGNWGSTFVRPYIMDPTSDKFQEVAAVYYKALAEVMGTSKYYSMDPFHEGGSIKSGKYAEGYRAIYDAMNDCCGSDTKWVIQQWQWASYQATSLTAVPAGRLVVLDLFSDGNPAFDSYKGYAPQHAIYCAIPNFGGRTGFMGRLPKMADNYAKYKKKYASVRGIGVAPEAIEQTPVAYDLLFELPWHNATADAAVTAVDTKAWMADYVLARYGETNADAAAAWETLRSTALNNTTTLQGPHEAVMCARPSLTVNKVSAWGGSDIFYDTQKFLDATYGLLRASESAMNPIATLNMSYDLCDIVRQSLSDYSKSLLAGINSAHSTKNADLFAKRRDKFLQLILDTDRLLATNRMFRLGNWTETARQAASEIEGATTATPDWYELDNARTLITTWGDKQSSEWGLRDYSYRQWQGMLSDYYYPRWKYWFDHDMQAPSAGWFYSEWNWAHELEGEWGASAKGQQMKAQRTYYTAAPEGDTHTVAQEVFRAYVLPFTLASGKMYYAYRGLDNNCTNRHLITLPDGTESIVMPFDVDASEIEVFCIDFNGDGTFVGAEVTGAGVTAPGDPVPNAANILYPTSDTAWGTKVKAQVTLYDGTTIQYRYQLPAEPNAIKRVTAPFESAGVAYDLHGHRTSHPRSGSISIHRGGLKVKH